MILLLIVTLGIYGIYWTVAFQNDIKRQTGEGFGGIVHLILIFVTFGIYYLYWCYKTGERLEKIGASNQGVIYLILNFVALGWLNPFLMQAESNKTAPKEIPEEQPEAV